MTTDEAIQLHGADAAFTAASAGECEDYAPLQALGLNIETIEGAERISLAAYQSLTVEEKAANYWEASQDMHKSREPVQWDDVDYQIGPRMSHESESDSRCYSPLLPLIQQEVEKRRSAK